MSILGVWNHRVYTVAVSVLMGIALVCGGWCEAKGEQDEAGGPLGRVLMLPAGGPLLLEIRLKVGDKPLREAQLERCEKLWKSLDRDNNGQVSWEEAARNPRFVPWRFGFRFDDAGLRPGKLGYYARYFSSRYDTNNNQQLDVSEHLHALESSYGRARLEIGSSNSSDPKSVVFKLLDVDEDGRLSAAELKGAADRIKSRDSNNNELIEFSELQQAVASTRQPGSYPVQTGFPMAVSLSAEDGNLMIAWVQNRQQMLARSGVSAQMPALPIRMPRPAGSRPSVAERLESAEAAQWESQHWQALYQLLKERYSPKPLNGGSLAHVQKTVRAVGCQRRWRIGPSRIGGVSLYASPLAVGISCQSERPRPAWLYRLPRA